MSDKEKKKLSDEEIAELKDKGTGHGDRLEAIAQNVSKQHLEEAGVEVSEEEPEVETPDKETDTEKETPEKKPKKEKQPPDTDLVTLKIDGEEVKKPKSEVEEHGGIKAYQLELAAQKRIEAATLKQKELDKREAEIAKRESATGKKLPEQDAETDEEEEEVETPETQDAGKDLKKLKDIISEKRKAYHNAVEFGEEDEIAAAATALDEAQEAYYDAKYYTGAKATQNVDVEQIADQVSESLTKKQILSKFQEEFEDVWKDPEAMARAKFEVDLLMKAGKPNEWATYETAASRARQQMGWEEPEGKTPTPEHTAEDKKRQQKIEKKRKIENIDAATAKTESIKTEEKPQTREETIHEMAGKRVGARIY